MEKTVGRVFDRCSRSFLVVTESSKNLKEQTLVPFLPVNPELSTMRNQGRQKLARLSKEEFATLVWDILSDCKRRQAPFGKFMMYDENKAKSFCMFIIQRKCFLSFDEVIYLRLMYRY